MTKTTLILGGTRSGKSAYAESLASKSGRPKIYLATAEAADKEMAKRIAQHKARRRSWQTIEEPHHIAEVIANPGHKDAVILVDCLTLWLANLMHHELGIKMQTHNLLDALKHTRAEVLLVSNEVGQGIVPTNKLARQFRDEAGLLHQRIAQIADKVIFMTAGIPTTIKG